MPTGQLDLNIRSKASWRLFSQKTLRLTIKTKRGTEVQKKMHTNEVEPVFIYHNLLRRVFIHENTRVTKI